VRACKREGGERKRERREERERERERREDMKWLLI
jgi:hypothetical protein